jgi:predicted anti-sigma-YlaC factor YlaD
MSAHAQPGRICREVQGQLAGHEDGSLSRWRRRLVDLHLRRCEDCRWELDRQRAVATGLTGLSAAVAEDSGAPPEGLLDSLLSQAEHRDLRSRAAIPARGAVSGARPGLSAALLLAGAATGTALGFAGWRGARAVSSQLRGRRRQR